MVYENWINQKIKWNIFKLRNTKFLSRFYRKKRIYWNSLRQYFVLKFIYFSCMDLFTGKIIKEIKNSF